MRMETAQRLAFALAVSAGAHVAVLANTPLAPGLGDAAPFGGRQLTARIVSAYESAENSAPSPVPSEPEPRQGPVAASAVAQAAALPSAEIYFRGSEVDERAAPLNDVNLVYPDSALAARQSGVVTLRLKIDHQGVLRDATIVEAQPSGIFEAAAMQAVQALKFRPAMRNGVQVGSLKTIEVPFYPDCKRTESCIAGEPGGAAAR
jgi:protein TonB